MKILIFCQYYYPERFLLNEIAPELARRGNEVTVITGIPNYPEGKIYPGYEDEARMEEIIDGVNVIRCNIIPRGHNKVQLLANYFSYMIKANKKARKLKDEYDIVFLYQLTPIFQAYPAIKFAKTHNIKLLCYCLDLAPASGEDVAVKVHFLFAFYRYFSRWAYSNCNKIAVTSKGFVDYLNSIHSIGKDKIIYLPQHASDSLLYEDLTKTHSDGVVDFMFAGNIGYGARLDYVIEASEILKRKGMKFRVNIVGDGSDKERLRSVVSDKHLNEYVFFFDSVPMSEMGKMYRMADALIVTLRKGQLTVPSKIQAYMATGKPILGAMDGSGKELIEEAQCGKCCPAEDVNGLAKLMGDYLSSPSKYALYGENGRDYFLKNFTLNIFCDSLEKLFTEML